MNSISVDDLKRQVSSTVTNKAVEEVIDRTTKVIQILSVAGVKEHFQTSTSPEGRPWAKLVRPRVGGGDKPLLDKGLLQNSVSARLTGKDIVLIASHAAANLHQYGGTVKAKGKMLAIPMTPEAKRIGSPRKNKFPRPLQVMVSDRRNVFLVERQGNKLTFHYILKKSVTVPARPFLGFSEKTLTKIEAILANRLMDVVGGAFDKSKLKLDWETAVSTIH